MMTQTDSQEEENNPSQCRNGNKPILQYNYHNCKTKYNDVKITFKTLKYTHIYVYGDTC